MDKRKIVLLLLAALVAGGGAFALWNALGHTAQTETAGTPPGANAPPADNNAGNSHPQPRPERRPDKPPREPDKAPVFSPAGQRPITPDEASRTAVSGRISDGEGKPLPGVKLKIRGRDGDLELLGAEGTSAADGSFKLALEPLPPDPWRAHLVLGACVFSQPRPFKVAASLDGYTSEELVVTLAPETTTDAGVITLRAMASLDGFVVDEHGAPVKDCSVTLHTPADGAPERKARPGAMIGVGPGGHGRSFAKAKTGDDGRFSLNAPAGSYSVYAYAPMSGEATQMASIPSPEPVTLTLSRGLAIFGQVVDANGAAVKGARVAIIRPAQGTNKALQYSAICDMRGEFGAFNVENETHTVSAGINRFMKTIDGVAPSSVPLKIQLDGGATIRGHVYDARTNAPIPAFQVTAQTARANSSSIAAALTSLGANDQTMDESENGEYAVTMLLAGAYRVTVRAAGYEPVTSDMVTVAENAIAAGVDFFLYPEAALGGVAKSPAGDLLSGVIVQAFRKLEAPPDAPDMPPFMKHRPGGPFVDENGIVDSVAVNQSPIGAAVTDAQGHFQIKGLRHGDYTLVARHGTRLVQMLLTVAQGEARDDILFQFVNDGGLHVRVLNARGEAMTGFPVLIKADGGYDNGRLAVTDASGIAKYTTLQPGSYSVEIREQPGTIYHREEATASRQQATVVGGATGDVTLTIAAEITLDLTVTAGGQPVANANVSVDVLNPRVPQRKGKTDESGHTVITALRDGHARVMWIRNRERWTTEITLTTAAHQTQTVDLVRTR